MKKLQLQKAEFERFEKLCKLFNFKVETDATWEYTANLCEIPHYYLRIVKNNEVVCIANLVQ